MSAQTSYSFNTKKGGAGGIYDLAPYVVNTFINESATGAVKPGMGVVRGTTAGVHAKKASAVTDIFEGILTNRLTTERDLEGNIYVRNKTALGVMEYGIIWGLLKANDAPAYGDAVYLVCTGDDAGTFTKTAGANTMAINARFVGGADNGVAPIELQQKNVVDATLGVASTTVLGGIKVGTGLAIDANGVLSVNG